MDQGEKRAQTDDVKPGDRAVPEEETTPEDEPPGDGLEEHERLLVRRRDALRPLAIHAVIRAEGEEALERPSSSLAFSGLAAGLSMGFSFLVPALLEAGLPAGAAWVPLVASLGYTVGFLIVTLGRQQLFTETTLTVVLPLVSDPSWRRLARMLKFWAVVLIANLLGALLFATMAAYTSAFSPPVKAAFHEIGVRAMEGSWATILVRAILAGWLIALVVWIQPMARTAWIWVIVILTYVVGLAGLAHIIAGSVDTLYLVVQGEVAWSTWAWHWMLPTLIGNIIGGVSLVAGLNHAQSVIGVDVDVSSDPRPASQTEDGGS
jgi:formate/nitrite transporter FocA (FNT family)